MKNVNSLVMKIEEENSGLGSEAYKIAYDLQLKYSLTLETGESYIERIRGMVGPYYEVEMLMENRNIPSEILYDKLKSALSERQVFDTYFNIVHTKNS
jgi:hypothetical protein